MSESEAPNHTNPYIITRDKAFKKQPHLVIYVLLGCLCCIPLLGAVGGLIMVILGAVVYKDKILIIMGSCGMLITIAIYSFLIYMASDINNFSEPMQQMTEMQLKTLVKDIEFYKTTKGTYPATLKILTDGGYSDVYGDPSKAFYHKQAEKIEPYYYQLQGDKYYLFSTGKDGKPFTKDDILPPFHGKSDYEKIGLIAR